jgi:hypothetical protein
MSREWIDGDYVVTTDRTQIDMDVVHQFLAEESYWARWRSRAFNEQVVAGSTRCYVLVHRPSGRQVGFARVLTDGAFYAWIGDVFVHRDHRGGNGKFLMTCVMDDLSQVHRVMLDTRDAHGLYAQVGFRPLAHPERGMERVAPSVTPSS